MRIVAQPRRPVRCEPDRGCRKAARSRAARRALVLRGMPIAVRIEPVRQALERVKGIEPSSVAWEATALPLSYTRVAARVMYGNRGISRNGARVRSRRLWRLDPAAGGRSPFSFPAVYYARTESRYSGHRGLIRLAQNRPKRKPDENRCATQRSVRHAHVYPFR